MKAKAKLELYDFGLEKTKKMNNGPKLYPKPLPWPIF